MGLVLPVVVGLFLSGCAAPATPKDDATRPTAAIPSSLDVDLHDYVLNITMPEGQPTMLVALNVTKDMWVRPLIGIPGARVPATDSRAWVLCPWVKSFGLSGGAAWTSAVFLQVGTVTKPSGATDTVDRIQDDSTGGICVGSVGWEASVYSVSANEPINARLWVLITARPTSGAQIATSWVSPEYRLHVGIGARLCQNDSGATYCPPETSASASPMARGGPPIFREFVDGKPCNDCGFKIDDRRTLNRGTIRVERATDVRIGITAATAGFGTNAVAMEVSADNRTASIRCTDRSGNGWANMVVGHLTGSAVRATFDETGAKGNLAGSVDAVLGFAVGLRLRVLEIPINITAADLRFDPFIRAYSGAPSPESETTTGLCL